MTQKKDHWDFPKRDFVLEAGSLAVVLQSVFFVKCELIKL